MLWITTNVIVAVALGIRSLLFRISGFDPVLVEHRVKQCCPRDDDQDDEVSRSNPRPRPVIFVDRSDRCRPALLEAVPDNRL